MILFVLEICVPGTHLDLLSPVARSKIDVSERFKNQKNRAVSAVLLVFEAFKNIHFGHNYNTLKL